MRSQGRRASDHNEGAVGALESSNGYTAPPIPDTPYGNPWGAGGTIEPPAYASPFD